MNDAYKATGQAASNYVDAVHRAGTSLWEAWQDWSAANTGFLGGQPVSAGYTAAIDVAEKLVCDAQQVQSDCVEYWRMLAHPSRPSAEVRHLSDGLDAMSEWTEAVLEVQRTSVRTLFSLLRALNGSEAWKEMTERADPQRAFELWEEFFDAWSRSVTWTGAATARQRRPARPTRPAVARRNTTLNVRGGAGAGNRDSKTNGQ